MADEIKVNEDTGEIEVYDKKTGKKVGTQKRKEGSRKGKAQVRTKTVTTVIKERIRVFSPKIKKRILDLTIEGENLTFIAREIGENRRVLYKWLAHNHEFRKEFEAAKKMTAYHLEEKMEDLIEKTDKKSKVMVNKFKFDAMKTLAEIKNPARYGKKTTIEGNEEKPVKIVFSTGIDRSLGDKRGFDNAKEILVENEKDDEE